MKNNGTEEYTETIMTLKKIDIPEQNNNNTLKNE